MSTRLVVLLVAVVLGGARLAAGQEPAVRADQLPIDYKKLETRLRQARASEDRYGLKIRYQVDVYGKAPRIELFTKVNSLGIGAQGLGGLATVLDVKILDYPTHAANLPVAMIPNCAATRHAHFTLDGSGVAKLEAPDLSQWPKVEWAPNTETSKRVDLNALTPEEVASWKPGQTLLLNGKMLTGRDAAHKRIKDMLDRGEELPVEFKGRVIVRAAVLIPWAIPTIVSAQMWAWMLNDQFGIINHMLMAVGIIDNPIAWTASATYSMWAVIMVDVWKTIPFVALLVLAALQMLPKDCYEAAEVDGIHPVRVFFKVTLPLIRPGLFAGWLLVFVPVIQELSASILLFSSKSITLAVAIYNLYETGYIEPVAALAMINMLIIGAAIFVANKLGGGRIASRSGAQGIAS